MGAILGEITADSAFAVETPEIGIRGNPFFERWMIAAAVDHLRGGRAVEVMSVGDSSALGFLPIMPMTPYSGIGKVSTIWAHQHCFDTTPVIMGDPHAALEALLTRLSREGTRALRWPLLPMDTQFYEALTAYLQRHGLSYEITKVVQRPILNATLQSGADYLETTLNGKRQREMRRCRRRLEELGKLEFHTFDGVHDAGEWAQTFLDIEASGWRGAEGTGTAMACRNDEAAFFTAKSRQAAESGRALVYSLTLGGQPIAMSVNFRTSEKVWGFKTAYRGDLAKYSPGVLLEIEATVAALDDPSIAWIDSCAAEDGGLMGELWPDRRPVCDMIISTQPSSNTMVAASGLLWRAYLAAKKSSLETLTSLRMRFNFALAAGLILI